MRTPYIALVRMRIPNIYTHKHTKYFILVPLVLLLFGLYFSTKIVLDTSLSGGAMITMQSNTTLTQQQLSAMIGSALHVLAPTVQKSSGTVTITIPANQSISNAYDQLLAFYSNQTLYDTYLVNQTEASIALKSSPDNSTIMAMLDQANAGMAKSAHGMSASLSAELSSLNAFIPTPVYNSSDVASMASIAQRSYTNASLAYQRNVVGELSKIVPSTSPPSYQPITEQQGRAFLAELVDIVITAFVLVSIVVFVIFRSPIPSFAVVFGAANDIIIALGAMGLFGIPLGIASIGGLLMLIGYSIDTDLLTSIRILKRHEGTPEERAYSSMSTGLTMTGAAIASFAVLFVFSMIAYVPTYYEIAGVVLFGLIGDLATTWLGNASIILAYTKRKRS